jgi:hypothetical protein
MKTNTQKAGEACRDKYGKEFYSTIAKNYWNSPAGIARKKLMRKQTKESKHEPEKKK